MSRHSRSTSRPAAPESETSFESSSGGEEEPPQAQIRRRSTSRPGAANPGRSRSQIRGFASGAELEEEPITRGDSSTYELQDYPRRGSIDDGTTVSRSRTRDSTSFPDNSSTARLYHHPTEPEQAHFVPAIRAGYDGDSSDAAAQYQSRMPQQMRNRGENGRERGGRQLRSLIGAKAERMVCYLFIVVVLVCLGTGIALVIISQKHKPQESANLLGA
ncbi:hypothetical protein JCM10908_005155 [Rhodotorula pacifica]|uniref:uncharacterized protein n=1 Tax=Rhodotorula pacifica TaxID=1495444 RepID=UPI00317C78D5